jgi:hypothetical protein
MDALSVDSPFSEAAHFYEFRAPYAPQALAYVRDALQLDKTSRIYHRMHLLDIDVAAIGVSAIAKLSSNKI